MSTVYFFGYYRLSDKYATFDLRIEKCDVAQSTLHTTDQELQVEGA